MKYLAWALSITALLGVVALVAIPAPKEPAEPEMTATSTEHVVKTNVPRVEVVAEGLVIPWDIAFLPNGSMLVTERTGHVIEITESGEQKEIAVPGVKRTGEGGLLGILLHPEFAQNHLLYLYMSTPGASAETENRIVRYVFENETLTEEKTIIDGIPGAIYHDGGRMEFGPDGYLYVTTGDATRPPIAQNVESLGGKILRLTSEGEAAPGNPFNTRVYTYGHRNPQGLAWDAAGRLWETEHGPTGDQGACCHDEINILEVGKNYGWPESIGDDIKSGTVAAIRHSGDDTWAPSSLAYLNGKLYFGGLKGEALYEAIIEGTKIIELKEHFKGEYGRIRTVRVGPDGLLYITTSNRDGRGSAKSGDDKIISVNPELL